MGSDYMTEPENGVVKFELEVVKSIRKEFNLDNEVDREKAIEIISDWIKQQDHFVKKDYSKGYIERCIITCKGSLERTKQQIDKICTIRTLVPKYFEITNIRNSELGPVLEKADIAILPKLTGEYYRVVLIKAKPNQVVQSSYEFTLLFKLVTLVAEYLKSTDCCRGFIIIQDFYDVNVTEVLPKVNLVELQQFIPILTEGYGCKLKGIHMVTASKFIEGFIKLIKPLFSEKIASRIHAVTSRDALKDLVQVNVLPEDYGGPEKSIKQLNSDLIKCLSDPSTQEIFEDMNKAVTDETRRQVDKFNDQYMGMPGSFRTLSLD